MSIEPTAFDGVSPATLGNGMLGYGRPRIPDQRWQIAPPNPTASDRIAEATGLSPLLAQVLINRGITTSSAAAIFLNPELQQLPSPLDELPDLAIALDLLAEAIEAREKIAICGDYDADGMTSTALLIRALRILGARVDYAIPSRMSEGYGINQRIIEEFHRDGVGLVLTVDNGIAAHAPIARARELGLTVIITDHHDLPPTLPPAHAILNPKLIREDSPYRGLAGVGVAYVLAVCLAQYLGKTKDLATPLLELFTLGTIADLAPLTGVNRRWVRRGLKLLPQSRLAGVQALIQVAGLSHETGTLKPEAIGFRLGPRINAVGRIHNPEIVIELLTTDEPGYALERAMECEQVNQCRQQLCELIEKEAITWIEDAQPNLQNDRVLVIVQPNWHHGVIGIVASRLVERYGVPVFIGTYEDDDHIRGSARGIPEFNVFEALQFCGDALEKFGGHRAAGGFTLRSENLSHLRSRLRLFANMQLQLQHLKPLIRVDVRADFDQINLALFDQIDALHPCGIENPDPVFWTPNVRVLDQKTMGRSRNHLKVTLTQDGKPSIRAIAWRWGEYCPLPNRVDIAYRLRLNEWNGQKNVELELVGVRLPTYQPLSVFEPSSHRAASALPEDELPLFNAVGDLDDAAPVLDLPGDAADPRAAGIPFETDSDNPQPTLPDLPQASPLAHHPEPLTHPAKERSPLSEPPLGPPSDPSIPFPASARRIAPFTPRADEPPQSPHPIQARGAGRSLSEQYHSLSNSDPCPDPDPGTETALPVKKASFTYNQRKYVCSLSQVDATQELRIRNPEGQVLAVQPQHNRGLLGRNRAESREVDISHPHIFNLIQAALDALNRV